jgi:hypothetical protein
MNKQAPNVEWQITESDADWERVRGAPLPNSEPVAQRRLPLKRFLWEGAAIVCLLASAGGWWWRMDRGGLQQTKAGMSATAQQEVSVVTDRPDRFVTSAISNQADTGWWLQYGGEVRELRTTLQTAEPGAHLDVVLDTVEVHGDQAVTRVVRYTEQGAPAYRQMRFYRRIGPDWRQTAPDAALWGPERSLETTFLVFHFRQNDASAVIAVATQMDALYTMMRHNFGLPIIPTPEKLLIEVNVTHPPGHPFSWFVAPDRLIVPSPALYWAPVELTDVDLLAQSIALPLLNSVLAQASEQYQIDPTWQPLLRSLRLWQVWDLDLPLAVWREEVVRWLYLDLPATSNGQTVVPDQDEELCAAHLLWMRSPAQLGIPVVCTEVAAWHFSWWVPPNPFTRLNQLILPPPSDSYGTINHPGQTVALATLVEYAVATYGRERLPALVAGLGQYESWNTLIPAVFGVSATEFEAGWQAYLTAHYGVIDR